MPIDLVSKTRAKNNKKKMMMMTMKRMKTIMMVAKIKMARTMITTKMTMMLKTIKTKTCNSMLILELQRKRAEIQREMLLIKSTKMTMMREISIG